MFADLVRSGTGTGTNVLRWVKLPYLLPYVCERAVPFR